MHRIPRLFLLCALLVGAGFAVAPSASAANRNNTRTMKSIDVSQNPAVEAAQKKRAEAAKAYQEAKAKLPVDKAAVEAAKATLDEATKVLGEARKKAYADAKKKKK